MTQRLIIYSHGFGVHKDDRGLFTGIAAALPDVEHVMFDYNKVDETANILTVAPLDEQAPKLKQKIAEAKSRFPDAVIDLIAHSQGCVVAALAKPEGIRKAIFIAAPMQVMDTEVMIRRVCAERGITFDKAQTIRLPRKDGSTTIIPPSYWIAAAADLDAQELYNEFAKQAELTILTATEDEVLGIVHFDRLDPGIKIVAMRTGHNFEDEGRAELITAIGQGLDI